MSLSTESITQEFSPYIGETDPKKVADILSLISHHPDVVRSHRVWENYDQKWKDATKNGEDDSTIMKYAALTRESKKAKDHIHDAAATVAHDIAMASGILQDFTYPTLGEATPAGSVPELSVEWHNLRKTGIGGSTVSKVLGFHWKSSIGRPVYMDNTEYNDMVVDMAVEKMAPTTHAHIPEEGVLYRGHMWEPATLAWLSVTHGITIAISKDTWTGVNPHQIINVDGIMVDDKGEAIGIVECKTSSREWTWEKGVPVNYRAQVLWYLNSTGLRYAQVIVRFDSGDFEVFTIEADETIDSTEQTNTIDSPETILSVNNVWDTLMFYRQNKHATWEDSTRLGLEAAMFLDLADSNHHLAADFSEALADGFVGIHATFTAPYERMDEKFTVPATITVKGITYRNPDIPYPLYPLEKKPDEDLPTFSEDTLDDILGDGVVFATDTATYMWVTSVIGKDGVVNASALRRWVELDPGGEDWTTTENMVAWINTL